MIEEKFNEIKKEIKKESLISKELNSVFLQLKENEQNEFIKNHIDSLKKELEKTNNKLLDLINKISFESSPEFENFLEKKTIPEEKIQKNIISKISKQKEKKRKFKLSKLEKRTIKRINRKEKKRVKKEKKKPKTYIRVSNKLFSNYSKKISHKKIFLGIKDSLKKTNLQYTEEGYISVILFNTFIAAIFGVIIFLFLVFFNINLSNLGISFSTKELGKKAIEFSWIIILLPLLGFLFSYMYPKTEEDSAKTKIEEELPFATLNMAAISGALINPTNIFKIIIETKEYPYLGKEFTKLVNEVDVYGTDLISALRSSAIKSPSIELSNIFNGLATAIDSGGDLSEFFQEKADKLIFEYKLKRERYSKFAETFMDIYISIVVAAPMVFMLLLMMMKISRFGLSLSTPMISLIMASGVSIINVVFLVFLKLKHP